MSHKQVLFRSAAREKILRGATQLADALRVTRGLFQTGFIEKKWAHQSCATTASRLQKNLT